MKAQTEAITFEQFKEDLSHVFPLYYLTGDELTAHYAIYKDFRLRFKTTVEAWAIIFFELKIPKHDTGDKTKRSIKSS
jgi:hypothetical protein